MQSRHDVPGIVLMDFKEFIVVNYAVDYDTYRKERWDYLGRVVEYIIQTVYRSQCEDKEALPYCSRYMKVLNCRESLLSQWEAKAAHLKRTPATGSSCVITSPVTDFTTAGPVRNM